MRKTLKKITASLTAMLMMFGSTYTAVGSASAADNDLHGWHVYGDVDDDGFISLSDAVLVSQFITEYKNAHNHTLISVKDALNYRKEEGEYYLPVPQAADIDGDGYITDADQICMQNYMINNRDGAGRCGQSFFIN